MIVEQETFGEILSSLFYERGASVEDVFLLYTFRPFFDSHLMEDYATKYPGSIDEKLRLINITHELEGYEDAVRLMTDACYRSQLIRLWENEIEPELTRASTIN